MQQDSHKALLAELFAMTFHGVKPGLDRIQELLDPLDMPHRRYPVVHVAGTNGKGSVCSMMAAILRAAGYKVGLYTSPHIRTFGERIRVNGEMISDSDIARLASPLMERAKPIGGTFFEVTTAMAFQYFAEKRVDIAVIEVGMGGRLDATNVVDPMLTVITAIDMDHTEYLGNSISKIAAEKGGIIKEGIPVVVGEQSAMHAIEVYKTLNSIAGKNNADIMFANDVVKVELDKVHPDFTMSVSVIDDDFLSYYDVGVAGTHQAANVATVLAALPFLQQVYFINADQVRYGFKHVRELSGLRNRISLVPTLPTTILDVSHNPAGVQTLVKTVLQAGYAERGFNVVFGAMQDKDFTGMLQQLLPVAKHFHVCSPDIARAATTQELSTALSTLPFVPFTVHQSVQSAFQEAQRLGATIACGSFHVADEVEQFLTKP